MRRLPDTIRRDRIDILVDLTMHMADNRLPVFRPVALAVPVQVSGLAYAWYHRAFRRWTIG